MLVLSSSKMDMGRVSPEKKKKKKRARKYMSSSSLQEAVDEALPSPVHPSAEPLRQLEPEYTIWNRESGGFGRST